MRVVVPLMEESVVPAAQVVRLAKEAAGEDGKLVLLSPLKPVDGKDTTAAEDLSRSVESSAKEQMEQAAKEAGLPGEMYSTEVKFDGSIPEAIIEVAAREQADLIAMGASAPKGIAKLLPGSKQKLAKEIRRQMEIPIKLIDANGKEVKVA